jgi:hypothetical protein
MLHAALKRLNTTVLFVIQRAGNGVVETACRKVGLKARKAMFVLPRSSEGQRAEGDVTRMALDDAALDFVVAGAPVEVPLFWPCVAFLGVALRGCESGRVGAGA